MIDGSFFQLFIFADFSTSPMERKSVLPKKSDYWYAFLKHSFNSGFQKTTMKEYGKEDTERRQQNYGIPSNMLREWKALTSTWDESKLGQSLSSTW